jgi:hypothetical protein
VGINGKNTQKSKGQTAAESEANKGLSLQKRQSRDAAKWMNFIFTIKISSFLLI